MTSREDHTPVTPSTSRLETMFRRAAARLDATQEQLLVSYLDAARGSEFATRHGLTRARTVAEFRDAVPIRNYEDMAKDVERMRLDTPGVLFDAVAEAFVKTGGTSGNPKVFPRRALLNREIVGRALDSGLDTELRERDHPGLKDGRLLSIIAAPPARGELGYMSGYSYANGYQLSRAFREKAFVNPLWLTLMQPARRAYLVARLSVGADIRHVTGLPNALIALLRMLETDGERLVRDVRDGTLTGDLDAAALEILPKPAPDAERAKALERAAAENGRIAPRDLWPHLTLVQTFIGAGLAPNRDHIATGFGVPIRELGYSSTEAAAVLAFPVRDEDINLALAIHTAFCEFVDANGVARLAHELTVGDTYGLVITTPHGLYRYNTGDLVRVTGSDFDGVPVFRVAGRDRTVDLIGERLTEVQMSDAVARAGRVAGGPPPVFVAVPHPTLGETAPFYEIVCQRDARVDAAKFESVIDAELSFNFYYGSLREDASLSPCRVTWAPPAWFDALRARRQLAGDLQAKTPIFASADALPDIEREK